MRQFIRTKLKPLPERKEWLKDPRFALWYKGLEARSKGVALGYSRHLVQFCLYQALTPMSLAELGAVDSRKVRDLLHAWIIDLISGEYAPKTINS